MVSWKWRILGTEGCIDMVEVRWDGERLEGNVGAYMKLEHAGVAGIVHWKTLPRDSIQRSCQHLSMMT